MLVEDKTIKKNKKVETKKEDKTATKKVNEKIREDEELTK